MNDVAAAFKLIRNWRRYEAVLHPRTIRFLWHWLRGSTHLPYPPLKLHLEPTSLCNLKCPMCPQSIGANKDNGFMDMDVYRHILEQVRGHVLEVNLFFRGEPMMHKNLGEMTTLAHEAGIAVHVNTNATTLRAKQTAMLLDSKLDKLTVSFDGADKETYERMRLGAKFELTLKNVREFLLEKQRRKVRYPYTVMQVILPYDPTAARPGDTGGDAGTVRRLAGGRIRHALGARLGRHDDGKSGGPTGAVRPQLPSLQLAMEVHGHLLERRGGVLLRRFRR